jgi:hypothetical protein
MCDFGYLVNIKTLFGDKDFWKICKTEHAVVYKALIHVIDQWPQTTTTKAHYHKVDSFSPIIVFEQHFKKAFDYIKEDLALEQSIEILSINKI